VTIEWDRPIFVAVRDPDTDEIVGLYWHFISREDGRIQKCAVRDALMQNAMVNDGVAVALAERLMKIHARGMAA
jgi:alpha-D-ribose 1-methylphosphonate 5-triphosphate synthase subunit PhnG